METEQNASLVPVLSLHILIDFISSPVKFLEYRGAQKNKCEWIGILKSCWNKFRKLAIYWTIIWNILQ